MRLLLNILLLLCLNLSALKFLVYNPCFGPSQVLFMGQIADTLAAAGHEVVNYCPEISVSCNITGTKLSRVLTRKRGYQSDFRVEDSHRDAWLLNHQSYFVGAQLFAALGDEFQLACEDQLKDEKLIKTLRNENFDLGLTESFDMCGFALFHKAGIRKYNLVFSFPITSELEFFGISFPRSFVPAMFVSSTTEKMSMWERVTNIASHYIYKYYVIGSHLGQTARAFPSDMPDYQEVLARSQYVFVNVDEHFDFPIPLSSKIVYIGGLNMRDTQKAENELSPEIKDACGNSRRGCVLISFGTIASSYAMDMKRKQAFVDAIRQFPDVTFIWKYEKTPDFDLPSNVLILPWVPQTQLLSNSRLLAMISHCGLNSVMQLAYKGVPVVCIPLFGDQTRNAAMVESRGVGVKLDKFVLNADIIVSALRKVLDDPSYRKQAQELSSMMLNKPFSQEEKLVRFTEHAARYDIGTNLDMYGRHLNWFTYNNYDILFLFLSLISTFVFVVFFFITRKLNTKQRDDLKKSI
ncbi:UDP-glucuronosyltransferase [Aphelenchoides besseyi]|nr:UDP-glucuronosyltransferase [Aphelenchoides besseyi]